MDLQLYNTLTRKIEPIRPADQMTLRFYCCGPTVYGPAHIGNLRTFVLQDLFRRVVEFLGVDTCHVRNITDLDDKTIRESQRAGLSLAKLTQHWRSKFEQDCAALNLLPPAHTPQAVAHIADQIPLIQKLINKGHAYLTADKNVYFRIDSFANYGRLSRLKPLGVRQNASQRLNDRDEYGKESWRDFVLWKAWKAEDGPNRWPSPWGWGRPGWHIECSAMSMRYLGESFDLHSGGVDLIFPHHENEIAQSEAASGKPFVRHWLHIAHLRVNGEKMSKSLGNLFALDQVRERGFSCASLRYLLLAGHYRQPLNFRWESLAAAETSLKRLFGFTHGSTRPVRENLQVKTLETTEFLPVIEALCQDLNTPKALGALNSALPKLRQLKPEAQLPVRRDLARVLQLMGFETPTLQYTSERPIPAEAQALAQQRQEARNAGQWDKADQLRTRLKAIGWTVRDSAKGFHLESIIPN